MSAIKRFFLFNLNWMNNCLKTTDSFLLTHSEDSSDSVLKLSASNAWQQTKIQHFIFKWFFFLVKYVRWKSHKFNFGTHTQLDPKFRQIEKSQICVHLKKNTETHENQIIKRQKDLKNKYDNVHFYYVLQTFDQITTGTSKSFKTAKACTNPRKIVASNQKGSSKSTAIAALQVCKIIIIIWRRSLTGWKRELSQVLLLLESTIIWRFIIR